MDTVAASGSSRSPVAPGVERATWFAAFAVGALALVLGLVTLGRKSFWYDEVFDARAIRGSWGALIDSIRGTEMSQSAYLVGLKIWSTGAGSSESMLRLPSVIAVALAAAVLVLLGARLFDRATGVIAGVLLATNDFVVQWSQQARTYAFVTLAVVVTAFLFVRMLDDDRWGNCAAYALACVVAIYFHFYAGFVVVIQALCLPFVRVRPRISRLALVGATIGITALPAVYFTLTAPRNQVSWIEAPTTTALWTTLVQNVGHNPLLAATAIAGLVLLAVGSATAGERWRAVFLGGWAMGPILLGLATSLLQPIVVPRYLIVITPALALLGAHAISTLRHHNPRAAALVCILLLSFSGYWIAHWYGRTPEDWRGAAAYVSLGRAKSDSVVVSPPWAAPALTYYAPGILSTPDDPSHTTLVVVRLDEDETPDEVARRVIDERTMMFVERRWFGERVAVETWRPLPIG